MRVIAALLVGLAAVATSADAQPSPQLLDIPPPINAVDMPNYCVFANRI
jgi:hypothetical protein